MGKMPAILFCLACLLLGNRAHAKDASQNGSIVHFRSGNTTLLGYVYKPAGPGPFPAIIYARAVNKPILESTPPLTDLAQFYTSRGFVFFIPSRRPNEDVQADSNVIQSEKKRKKLALSLPELANLTRDIAAAVVWMKSQSFADESRIAVVGHSAGALEALLLSEQDVEVRAYVLFSPATQQWKERSQIREALVDAVREAKAPLFLIQAQNDFTLEPSEVLGKEILKKGKPNKSQVYSPFGSSHQQGNSFAITGMNVWGTDVVSFLNSAFKM